MDAAHWLDDIRALYRQYKKQCEGAVAQVPETAFFATLGDNPHSIGELMKHVGGNHRSRWRDFLTRDGEKDDRHREREFQVQGETRASVLQQWEDGWRVAFDSLDALQPSDLERTITIRGEPHTVLRAVHRNLAHVVYHSGQIVYLARHFAGAAWESQSIAPGDSEAYNARMRQRFGDWDG